jgi:DNA-binding PadR family transcriptional regulator
MADERFRGLRLEIATALLGNWRTLYQTATALGRRSGDIQKALRQMHDEGVLEAEHAAPEPGTRYRLAEKHEAALAEALRADQVPGLVQSDQDLLLLNAPSRQALNAIFARGELAAIVSWAVRLGENAMLVALAPRASEIDYVRLLTALEEKDIEVGSHRTARISDGRALRAMSLAATAAPAGSEA